MSRLRGAVRRLAVATYRRAGAIGYRILGPDPAGIHPDSMTPLWAPPPDTPGVFCPICRWEGMAFDGPGHVELTLCPACGSNGRDRFLIWCLIERVDLHRGLRVLEFSPRLGRAYRDAMSAWFFYRSSDFDERAHRGNLRLDLQAIELPDRCVDVILCSHVLEHVPDTDAALVELRRVLAPGGHLLLQVPVLQELTTSPPEPEAHDDHTPVFWRFGFDLTARLRDQGFDADLLCPAGLVEAVASGRNPWPTWSGEFDVPGLLDGARVGDVADDLVVVADPATSSRLGFEPAYQYLTWDCRVTA